MSIISYAKLLKAKALALMAQMPPLVKIDPKCYRYHDHCGYFAWTDTTAGIVPILVIAHFTSDRMQRRQVNTVEFAIKQEYCRYYSREPLTLNLLGMSPKEANDYFQYGYDIETFINIYCEVPLYRANYFVDTPETISPVLHYLETYPLDKTTALKEQMALVVADDAMEPMPNLTTKEIALVKQRTANNSKDCTNSIALNGAKIRSDELKRKPGKFTHAARTALESAAANDERILRAEQQVRRMLQDGLTQCAKAALSGITLDVAALVDELLISSFSQQTVATYRGHKKAMTLRLQMNQQITVATYQPNGRKGSSAASVLACSLPSLLKKLVQQADPNGLIAIVLNDTNK